MSRNIATIIGNIVFKGPSSQKENTEEVIHYGGYSAHKVEKREMTRHSPTSNGKLYSTAQVLNEKIHKTSNIQHKSTSNK